MGDIIVSVKPLIHFIALIRKVLVGVTDPIPSSAHEPIFITSHQARGRGA